MSEFLWLTKCCRALHALHAARAKNAARLPVDPVALEEKRKRVLDATTRLDTPNPHLNELRAKLVELLAVQTKSKDEFINWITGLSTAAMYLALTNLDSGPQSVRLLLLLSGLASFGELFAAIAFKYFFANVRFSDLQLEVNIQRNLFQGHDINTHLTDLANQGTAITDADRQQFLQNMDESLNLIDPSNLHTYQKPVEANETLMHCSYRLSVVLFILGIALLVVRYALGYFLGSADALPV